MDCKPDPPNPSAARRFLRPGAIFVLDPSKRCEPSAYFFTQAVKFFLANGYERVEDIARSDIVLVNSCCVTEDKIAASLAALEFARRRAEKQRIVLLGCMADLPLADLETPGLLRIGPGRLDALEHFFPFRVPLARLAVHRLPPAFYEPGQGLSFQDYFVLIARGCVNCCAYCNIKRVKGHVRSRPPAVVLEEIQQGMRWGVEEFVLLADDCASYGLDCGTDLVQLLNAILTAREGVRLKLGYLFPEFVLTRFHHLKKIFATGRITYVNIPVQSGSQRILNLMNRRYAISDVRQAVLELRASAPRTRWCTHIMLNFPTETEADFAASLYLADAFETVLFLNYSDNRGTPAARIFPKVTAEEARLRLDQASIYTNRRAPAGGAVIDDFNCNLPYNLSKDAKPSSRFELDGN